MDMNDHEDADDNNGDGEGVWSPDIEQCFREAILLFPACGRRKHILQEEGGGKMYGRNELIARHIMMRTGKKRTRKQVSSHIQVLARREAKRVAATGSTSGASPSPSGIRSQSAIRQEEQSLNQQQTAAYYGAWVDRPIVTQKIRLVEFSAFIEHRNFQQSNGVPIVGTNMSNQSTAAPIVKSELVASVTDDVATNSDLTPVAGQLSNQMTGVTMAPYTISSPIQQSPHQTSLPLASNHHLPAQFNRASSFQSNSQLQNHHQKPFPGQLSSCVTSTTSHQLQQQQQASGGFTRHSYVQIDYSQSSERQANKLERIDISQIQDKFPEIGGPEGLFQRGPSNAFFLVKFWADLNNDFEYNIDDQNSYFGFSSHFETVDPYKDITCSTKACSYGFQVVEKVEKIYGAFNSSNGRYSYDINRSPMCEFMIQFIKKLRQLPRASQMNSVLENFTVLQVITSESTSEILLCLAYVFEVASEQNTGPQHHVYRLTKD